MLATESTDLIPAQQAITLPGLFLERCRRSGGREAYRQFDRESRQWRSFTWGDMRSLVGRWQSALRREQLQAGDRVAILAPNSVSWVCMDIAAQSLGLVVVPLYTTDNPENIGYILADAGASLLVVQHIEQWNALRSNRTDWSARCSASPPRCTRSRDTRRCAAPGLCSNPGRSTTACSRRR